MYYINFFKKIFFISWLFCAIGIKFIAQISTASAPTRSSFKALTNTQYTAHSELFAEFRPLIQNVPARFTAHLTQIGESFKPYTDAEVTLSLMIDGNKHGNKPKQSQLQQIFIVFQ